MKTNQRMFLALIVGVALVQLSCKSTEFYDDRSERQKDRDDCEERGGIWRDLPFGYCDLPTPTATRTAAVTPTSTSALSPTVELAQCDARDVVDVEIILNDDQTSLGGRNCWYTLRATNRSDTGVAFYVYENRDDHEGEMEPRWWLMYVDPGKFKELTGHGTFWNNGEWSYVYLERAAAVFYNDACGYRGRGIDYNDEAGTAEQFAYDLDPIYCRR
jgi:hypothetical protein